MSIEQINLDKLRSVFSKCVSEGKLNIDNLLFLCAEYIDNDFEKCKFEWKGKADCLAENVQLEDVEQMTEYTPAQRRSVILH